jgi:hypothetical protein
MGQAGRRLKALVARNAGGRGRLFAIEGWGAVAAGAAQEPAEASGPP